MDAERTILALKALGVRLSLNEERDGISWERVPPDLDPDLRNAVRRNEARILRDLLFHETVRFVDGRMRAKGGHPGEEAFDAGVRAFSEGGLDERLHDAWREENLAAFKEVLRECARASLKAFDAAPSPSAPEAEDAATDPSEPAELRLPMAAG